MRALTAQRSHLHLARLVRKCVCICGIRQKARFQERGARSVPWCETWRQLEAARTPARSSVIFGPMPCSYAPRSTSKILHTTLIDSSHQGVGAVGINTFARVGTRRRRRLVRVPSLARQHCLKRRGLRLVRASSPNVSITVITLMPGGRRLSARSYTHTHK